MISTVQTYHTLVPVLGSMLIGGIFGYSLAAAFMPEGDIKKWSENNRLVRENNELRNQRNDALRKLAQTQDELRELHESFNSLFGDKDAA